MVQVLSQFSAILSNVVHLKIKAVSEDLQLYGVEDVEWLCFLHQFTVTAVQMQHVSYEISGHFFLAQEDITRAMVAKSCQS